MDAEANVDERGAPVAAPDDRAADDRERQVAEAREAMLRAAELAVRLGVDLDGFMSGAFGAYLETNPSVREQVESLHLLARVNELRRRGAVAAA
jgi:hypothetical protein